MPLTANFIADFSSFINACADATRSTAEVEAAGDKLAASFNQSVQSAAGSLQNVGTGIADFGKKAWSVLSGPELAEFGHAVTEFAGDYIRDFAKAEEATVRLERALKNSGEASPAVANAYAEMAAGLQKISTFSHVAITDAQAIFTTIGEVGPANMQKTLEAAMNLAAFMGTDVVTAAKLMQKAAESNGEAVGRLKVFLGSAYEKGMDFNTIVDLIAKKFDGQFAAALETTNGHLQNLKNQMDDVNEKIGKQGAEALNTLIDAFHKLPEGVQTFVIASDSVASKIGPVSSAFGNLAQVMGTLWPAAMAGAGAAILEFGGTALAALISWPALIVAALVAGAIAIYKYWDDIVAYVKKSWEAIKTWMDNLAAAFVPVLAAVENLYNGIKTWLYDKLTALMSSIVARIKGDVGEIVTAFKWMYDVSVGRSIIPDMVTGIGTQFAKLQDLMVTPAWDAATQTIAAFNSITMPNAFSTMTMPPFDARPLPLMFSATSGLTQNAPGAVITLNMTGMLGTDDPQTRQIFSDLVSNAVMQGMRGGRLLGTA